MQSQNCRHVQEQKTRGTCRRTSKTRCLSLTTVRHLNPRKTCGEKEQKTNNPIITLRKFASLLIAKLSPEPVEDKQSSRLLFNIVTRVKVYQNGTETSLGSFSAEGKLRRGSFWPQPRQKEAAGKASANHDCLHYGTTNHRLSSDQVFFEFFWSKTTKFTIPCCV